MATIYLIVKIGERQTEAQKQATEASLERNYSGKWRDIGNGCYLLAVSQAAVTKDLSDTLGLSNGAGGTIIITTIDPYYGWADKSVWEWISTAKANDGTS